MLAIKSKKPSQRVRRSSLSRTCESERGCERGQQAKGSETIIADSLFTLRLSPKGGAKVHLAWNEEIAIDQIYKQLWKLYAVFAKQTGAAAEFNPSKYLDQATAVDWILQKVRELVPKEFDLDVSLEKSAFIIHEALETACGWNAFAAGRVCSQIEESNPMLFDAFIDFLKHLKYEIGVSLWWESYSIEWLNEQMLLADDGFENAIDADDCALCRIEMNEFNSGKPEIIRREIIDRTLLPIDTIEFKINQAPLTTEFERELASNLLEACTLFHEPYRLQSFGYTPEGLEQDAFLRYEDQSMVMWDLNGFIAENHQHHIDCEAQEGVAPTVIYLVVDAETDYIDYSWLRNGRTWPSRLENFFTNMYNLTERL